MVTHRHNKEYKFISIIGRKSNSLQSLYHRGRRHFRTNKSITLLYNTFNWTFTNFWHIKRNSKDYKIKDKIN